jgi:hypothetical protein
MISRRLLVFAGLLFAGAVNAQPFTHPLEAGTLLRYRAVWHTSQQQRDTSLTVTIQSPSQPFGERELDSLRPNVACYDWHDLFAQSNVQYVRRTDRATIQVYVPAVGGTHAHDREAIRPIRPRAIRSRCTSASSRASREWTPLSPRVSLG